MGRTFTKRSQERIGRVVHDYERRVIDLSRGRTQPRSLDAHEYDGPFKLSCYSTAGVLNTARLYVGKGLILAGNLAEYYWPDASDTDYIDVTAYANGTYWVWITAEVHPNEGYFTASYLPYITDAILGDNTRNVSLGVPRLASDMMHASILLGTFTVASGKVTSISQRWQGSDIHVPVRFLTENTGSDYYAFASWATSWMYRQVPDIACVYDVDTTISGGTTVTTSTEFDSSAGHSHTFQIKKTTNPVMTYYPINPGSSYSYPEVNGGTPL